MTAKCRVCKTAFTRKRPLQVVCENIECAIKHAESKRAKTLESHARKVRKEIREQREKLKSRADWLREAQAAFNAFIRERDKDKPCISCGRFHTGSWDAGHYRSVGAAPALRFHEDNVHRQCVPCNQHKSGNVIEYRRGLVARIGAARVEWLEQEPPPAKFTIEDAKRIKAEFKSRLKDLQHK